MGCVEWWVTEFGQTQRLPSLSRPVAGAPEALAQPPSRPRRVPGGPVAGDWEPSPLGPCAGREEEAPAAVAGQLGRCLPRRPSWASGLALSVQPKSSLETPGTAGKGLRLFWGILGWSLVGSINQMRMTLSPIQAHPSVSASAGG